MSGTEQLSMLPVSASQCHYQYKYDSCNYNHESHEDLYGNNDSEVMVSMTMTVMTMMMMLLSDSS